jgi:hypothetical protein
MDELTSEQRDALGALKASRGRCPTAETLVEYGALSADDRARHPAHDHVSICSRCQLVLLHMAEPRIEQKSRLQSMLPLAALLVLGVALTILFRSPLNTISTPLEPIRGAELQPLAPIGNIETLTEFSWESPIRADVYWISVTRGSVEVWSGNTSGFKLEAPAGVFEPGVEYRWTVRAEVRDNRSSDVFYTRMTSPPVSFTLSRRR